QPPSTAAPTSPASTAYPIAAPSRTQRARTATASAMPANMLVSSSGRKPAANPAPRGSPGLAGTTSITCGGPVAAWVSSCATTGLAAEAVRRVTSSGPATRARVHLPVAQRLVRGGLVGHPGDLEGPGRGLEPGRELIGDGRWAGHGYRQVARREVAGEAGEQRDQQRLHRHDPDHHQGGEQERRRAAGAGLRLRGPAGRRGPGRGRRRAGGAAPRIRPAAGPDWAARPRHLRRRAARPARSRTGRPYEAPSVEQGAPITAQA